MSLEINFLLFPELVISQFGHMHSACPEVHGCMHTHRDTYTHSLSFISLGIPKELPYYMLSFPSAGITRSCLWHGVSIPWLQSLCFLLTRTLLVLCFPTSPQMAIHCLLRTPTRGSSVASSALLLSLLEAETAQPAHPGTCQCHWGAGSWWHSGVLEGRLLHTHFHLPLGISGSEPAFLNSQWSLGWGWGVHRAEHSS